MGSEAGIFLMPNMQVLLERNQHFASIFNQGNLPFLPRLSMLIVTCLDARVDPAHFLGLELGDAVVMRSIGGRVTDEIIEHIAIMRALSVVVGALRRKWSLSITLVARQAASPTRGETEAGSSRGDRRGADRKARHHRPTGRVGRGPRAAPSGADSTRRSRCFWLRLRHHRRACARDLRSGIAA